MLYTEQIKTAMLLCFQAHDGQTDKSGYPYAFHPFHLAEQMQTEETIVTALLHDVVEDTEYTLEDIQEMGFPAPIIEAVALLTHDTSVPYMDYVKAIASNPIAKAVKTADLRHNSDPARNAAASEHDRMRLEKYHKALQLLGEMPVTSPVFEAQKQRHSIRKYAEAPIPEKVLRSVLTAGLLAPSGRNRHPWELIVVQEREKLRQLSGCRDSGASMLESAACGIVVLADAACSDTSIEDCANVMMNLHLAAHSFGLGSCWIQGRNRFVTLPDGNSCSAEAYVRSLLHFPETLHLEAILSLGYPAEEKQPSLPDAALWEKVHFETY